MNKKHILIIEDDLNLLKIFQMFCEKKFDVKVFPVDTGKKAQKVIEEEKIDLILTDLMLPDTHGLDLLADIKKREETKDIPVIIMSAISNKEVIIKGIKLGAEAYLVKPINNVELKNKFIEILKIEEIS